MIPADGEDGARFRGLARQLAGRWSLALVRPKGSKHERSVDAIEDAAAQSVAAIRATHPEGPYVLGGFCYGGVVAFEAARILEGQGETALLVFFDTPTPGYPNLCDWRFWVEFLASRTRISWRRRSLRPLADYARRILRMALWFAIRRIGPKKNRLWKTGPIRWLWFQAQSLYFSFYTPRATGVPILHFMAKDEADVLLKTSRHGWGKFGNVAIEWLPGNHDGFLLERSSLPAVADALVSWLGSL
jgi:thioesterase domain-containing protein